MTRQHLAIALLIPFSVLSAYSVYKSGYWGLFQYQFASPAGWQVLADLVIACGLMFVWIFPDAKRHNRNPWPYVVITLFLGSFGPLLYLVSAPRKLEEKE